MADELTRAGGDGVRVDVNAAASGATQGSETSGSTPSPVTAHVHEWQAHGLVRERERKEQCSPCSRLDDVLYDAVYAVQSCACGKVKRTLAANENVRRRGDDLRREARR